MLEKPFTVRPAREEDEPVISALVVEGFDDKFRPVFGQRIDRAVKIMESWVHLEHAVGGVSSLVIEADGEVAASVGVRVTTSDDDALARGLWTNLKGNLGLFSAVRASALLSYPRYAARNSEAYVERLVVSPAYRNRGMARSLLYAAEDLGLEAGKESVGLHVSGNNDNARKLYDSEGYEEISRQRSLLTAYALGIRNWLYLRKKI